MRNRYPICLVALACWSVCFSLPIVQSQTTSDALTTKTNLEKRFHSEVRPALKRLCFDCHSGKEAEAMLDLQSFDSTKAVARSYQTWSELRHRVSASEMPPADSNLKPTEQEKLAIVDWIDEYWRYVAQSRAGDPGLVPVRRLSNSEYNYAIRDLTGVDIRPTREFPIDPANEAGFDNSAESLTTSPALLNKYLSGAREVAQHIVFTADGLEFAPFPVMTDTDRDKYCVQRIIEFYKRQPVDLAQYFFAAWHMRTRYAEDPYSHADEIASEYQLSPKYLKLMWRVLHEDDLLPVPALKTEELTERNIEVDIDRVPVGMGPLAVVRRMWSDLPNDMTRGQEARAECAKIAEWVTNIRSRLEPKIENLEVRGIHKGAQPFVLWKNDQYAAYRQRPFLDHLNKLAPGADSLAIAAALTVPADSKSADKFRNSVEQFCRVFPDAFYISERGRDYVGLAKEKQEKGRLLSAGFHSMMGYYRDDQPLVNLILNSEQIAELDRLWEELELIAGTPHRQYSGFLWFERTDSSTIRDAEFDFARAEDKNATSPEMIERLAEKYIAKAERAGANEIALGAIERFYDHINRQIQWVEKTRLAAEPHHLDALERIAARAYRRDLTATQRTELREYYRELRQKDGLSHEDAVQDVFVSILMAPEFCFRVDLAANTPERTVLTDSELASRLSFFLWSSLPDEVLLDAVRKNRLHDPAELRSHVARMLQDRRVRALATEFGGQWLDFRQFESHNSVDRERFPAFNDELRSAMYQEPVRFLEHLIRNNRSILECIDADYSIVNETLARHYGLPWSQDKAVSKSAVASHNSDSELWQLIPDADKKNRGGLLTMSVFLTQNAPGRRTSPVKRGYWIVRRLLGEHIPPPPPKVPELPADESQLGELSLRETLARHREHVACAGCHNRFDSFGLIFENFGPIGELRANDLAGKPVDTRATFPSGREGSTAADLMAYLTDERRDEYVDNLIRKLFAYALGRTLILSDEPQIAQFKADLQAHDMQFASLIESIVLSPQFLSKRGNAEPLED